jgi:V/A-type H+-transporting ATPase subunit E
MEELRSTEILDKEIQADARKKAEKILKSADQECSRLLASVPDRISTARSERASVYEKQISQFEHDINAALPLEKKRYLASFLNEAVYKAIDEYLKTLTDAKRFELFERMFRRYEKLVSDKKIHARYYGIEAKRAETFLKKELGANLLSCQETEFERTGQTAVPHVSVHAGIILESDDRTVRCRLTTDELISEIQDTHSQELVDALFDRRLMND